MSEVKRWEPRNTIVGYDMQPLPDGSFVLFEDFDRVTAERDALQQRLTAADERVDVLDSAAKEMLRIAGIANQGSAAYNRAIVNLHKALNLGGGAADD